MPLDKQLKGIDYPKKIGEKVKVYKDHRGRERRKVTIDCGPGLTSQARKDATDINLIIKKFTKTGYIEHAKDHAGQYDDFTSVDFQTAMETVASVKSMFETLPAGIRNKFKGDPAVFLDYVNNPANKQEMIDMGVLQGNDGLRADNSPSTAPVEKDPETAPVEPTEATAQ